jgi:hypothetical protein
MKRNPFVLPAVALVCLTGLGTLVASEKEDAASLERLRGEIARRLPAGWSVTIEPGRPDRARGPSAESLAMVITSREPLPVEIHMPNPAAGQPPDKESRRVEIVLAVRPYLTPEQYQQFRGKDDQLVASRTTLERQLKKQVRWGFMGAEPIPPSAFDPKDDAQRRQVLEYALVWNRTEPDPLPTHHCEGLSFDATLPINSAITDKAKAKEYAEIVKTLDELLTPYEKSGR